VTVVIDERVKWMSLSRFKAKVKAMQRCEIEAFKHFDDVWQIEEEAVLVPFDMWQRIQRILTERELEQ
jgi:hypothetical protein